MDSPPPAGQPAAGSDAGLTAAEHLRDLIAGLEAIVWEADAQTFQFTFVSERARDLLGYPLERWLDNEDFWLNHLHPEDRDRAAECRLDAIREGGDHEFEYRMISAAGHPVWLRNIVHVVREPSGRPKLLRGLMVNINERRRIESDLRKVVTSARCILWHGLVRRDDAGELEWSVQMYDEEAAQRFLPLRREEGQTYEAAWSSSRSPDERERMAATATSALLEGKTGYSQEFRCVQADGEERWLYEDVYIEPQVRGLWRVVGVCMDVTERRQLEEQLRQAQKLEAVGRLAGGIAHDFNNLLAVITGYSEVLLFGIEAEAPWRHHLEEIRTAAERAAALTRQLLSFSRKQVTQPQVLDLNTLVSNLEKLLRRLIGEDIDLVIALEPQVWPVEADPGQVEQVVMNLAVNARDAMPGGGKLIIETANVDLDDDFTQRHFGMQPGPYVRIAVSDTGCGMDEQTLSHIFEPFYTTKDVGKGTGLGLATVFGIAKQCGGVVEAHSEPGRGATFCVFFPRTWEPVDALPAGRMGLAPPAAGSETVLIVEDEPSLRALQREVLEMNGYRTVEAANASEALILAERYAGRIHLMVADVVMPGMSGVQLAKALADTRPEMRVLYTSGYTDDAVLRHGIEAEGVPFLQKPYSPQDLAAKVRAVLDGP